MPHVPQATRGRHGRAVVLGEAARITSRPMTRLDLVHLERNQATRSASATAPLITSPPWVDPPVYKAPVTEVAPVVVEAPPVVVEAPPRRDP